MQRDETTTDPEDMLDLERVERAYRALIGSEETFMGSKILNAEVNGNPLFSPFETNRAKNHRFEGNTERGTFMDDVIEQEEKHSEEEVPETTLDDMLLVDETDYVTTKRVVVEKRESVLDTNKGYLLISLILIVSLAAIIAVLCLAKKCSNKPVLKIAETVREERRKAGDFDNIAESQQYQPRI